MKAKLKASILLLCALMLITGSVFGTIAFFNDKAELSNTFTTAGLLSASSQFTLLESKAVDEDQDGVYELTAEKVTTNSYTVFPGVSIPKDPQVSISGLAQDAYLFIKVDSKLPEGMTYAIEEEWEAISPGVYTYKGIVSGDLTANIIVKNVITVDSFEGVNSSEVSLNFTAYLVQAFGFDSAEEAWKNSGFGGTSGS